MGNPFPFWNPLITSLRKAVSNLCPLDAVNNFSELAKDFSRIKVNRDHCSYLFRKGTKDLEAPKS